MATRPSDDDLEQAAADAEATRNEPATPAAVHRSAAPVDPGTVYSVRVPVSLIEQLRVFAETRGTTPSALMRQWIIERLASESSGVGVGVDQLQATAAYLADVARRLDSMAATGKKAG